MTTFDERKAERTEHFWRFVHGWKWRPVEPGSFPLANGAPAPTANGHSGGAHGAGSPYVARP